MSLRLAASAAVLAISAPAAAIPLTFELTGSRTATFVLDSEQAPDRANSSTLIGDQIFYDGVTGIFGGVEGLANVSFGTRNIAALNIQSPDLGFTQFAGPDVFSGGAAAPVFMPGVYQLTSLVAGSSTLTISEMVADVPEPGALGLLGLGLIGLGFGVTKRRQPK